MTLSMNGLFSQFVALGVIATVTLFPTPEDLKDAVTPRDRDARIQQALAVPGTAIVDAPIYSDAAPVVVAAPFPLDCVNSADKVGESLDNCIAQLATYVSSSSSDTGTTRGTVVLPPGGATDPKVEEARAALANFCRVQWSAQLSGYGTVSPSCNMIQ